MLAHSSLQTHARMQPHTRARTPTIHTHTHPIAVVSEPNGDDMRGKESVSAAKKATKAAAASAVGGEGGRDVTTSTRTGTPTHTHTYIRTHLYLWNFFHTHIPFAVVSEPNGDDVRGKEFVSAAKKATKAAASAVGGDGGSDSSVLLREEPCDFAQYGCTFKVHKRGSLSA